MSHAFELPDDEMTLPAEQVAIAIKETLEGLCEEAKDAGLNDLAVFLRLSALVAQEVVRREHEGAAAGSNGNGSNGNGSNGNGSNGNGGAPQA